MSEQEVRPEILETFKKLGLEAKEDRVKFSFGASMLDDEPREQFKIKHTILNPNK